MPFHETSLKVRFHEVDSYGVVWHGNYAVYLEVARLALSEQFGLSLEEMKGLGVYAPIVEMKIRYRAFCRYGDEIIVKTAVLPTEKASLTFKYMIERKSDSTLIAEAETTHVLLTLEGKMLYQPPEPLKQRIAEMIKAFGL